MKYALHGEDAAHSGIASILVQLGVVSFLSGFTRDGICRVAKGVKMFCSYLGHPNLGSALGAFGIYISG